MSKIWIISEDRNCGDCGESNDIGWPITAFTEESVADLFVNSHSRPYDLLKVPMKLDQYAEYLKRGQEAWVVILTKPEEIVSCTRIDFQDFDYHGKWKITSEGLQVHIIAEDAEVAGVYAGVALSILNRRGIIKE